MATEALMTIDPSRLRSVPRPPPKSWRDKPIVEPKKIDTADVRWVAVRTAVGCEERVADELRVLGYRPYCPLGAKFVFWQDGKRSKHRIVRQFPVFARYIFVGLVPGQVLGKGVVDVREDRIYIDPKTGEEKYIQAGKRWLAAEKIEAVLSDSCGPIRIPEAAIEVVNNAELVGHWDETRSWREWSPFDVGQTVRIAKGAFESFYATVDARQSEDRIKILANVFGRSTLLELDIADVEAV
jgi:transcription antitermination factor NusG